MISPENLDFWLVSKAGKLHAHVRSPATQHLIDPCLWVYEAKDGPKTFGSHLGTWLASFSEEMIPWAKFKSQFGCLPPCALHCPLCFQVCRWAGAAPLLRQPGWHEFPAQVPDPRRVPR